MGAALNPYMAAQQRGRRLTLALLHSVDTRTRVLTNYIGRWTLDEGMKWCSYGQHALPATTAYFYISSWTNDGFMRNCKACRSAVNKVQYRRRKRASVMGR